MSVSVLTFFNNKGGVGKTSLVYHLSWMFAQLGVRVLVADLDPQANLTAAFLNEDLLAGLWQQPDKANTIFRSVKPLLDVADFQPIELQRIEPNLALIPGDIALSDFEDTLATEWGAANNDKNQSRPFRILTAFWRSTQEAAQRHAADLIIIDVGPNLGAINRATLLASDHVVIPLGADLFSLQGLRNLGPTLRDWKLGWKKRVDNWVNADFALPLGNVVPVGYIAMRHGVKLTRPVQAYTRWLDQIPAEFRRSVLGIPVDDAVPGIEGDPYCLARLKNYNSLMPLAQEARKPIFLLKSADGAIGAHANAVTEAYKDFNVLAVDIAHRIGLSIPEK